MHLVDFVNSWDEAIESCSTLDWENLTLEAANQLRERIREKSKERFNQWNMICEIVKSFSDALVNDKIRGIMESNNIPEIFHRCVRWDILHLCMEAEYADIVKPSFFAALSFYYYNGHFPCGYSGTFPKGRFVVF